MAITRKYITLEQFADFHQVNITVIHEFADFGLFEIRIVEDSPCIFSEDIERCERAIRLYKDFGVNKEGIGIILEMREQQAEMRKELTRLRHQLKKHEEKMIKLFSEEFFDAE